MHTPEALAKHYIAYNAKVGIFLCLLHFNELCQSRATAK